MKSIICLSLACMLFSAVAVAQPGPHSGGEWKGPPSAEERVERLSEDLGLDQKQKDELVEIFSAADEQRDAMREKHRKQMRDDMCALHEDFTAQIKQVLTEEQYAKFDEMTDRRKAHREDRRSRHKIGPGPSMDCEPDAQ